MKKIYIIHYRGSIILVGHVLSLHECVSFQWLAAAPPAACTAMARWAAPATPCHSSPQQAVRGTTHLQKTLTVRTPQGIYKGSITVKKTITPVKGSQAVGSPERIMRGRNASRDGKGESKISWAKEEGNMDLLT